MMVKIAAVFVIFVLGHELHDLQSTLGAVEVWKLDVRFKWFGLASGMHKQAIGERRYLDGLLNRRRHLSWTSFGVARLKVTPVQATARRAAE